MSPWFILQICQIQSTMLQNKLILHLYVKNLKRMHSSQHTNAFQTLEMAVDDEHVCVYIIKGPRSAYCLPALWQIQCSGGGWGCSPPLTESHDVTLPPLKQDIRRLAGSCPISGSVFSHFCPRWCHTNAKAQNLNCCVFSSILAFDSLSLMFNHIVQRKKPILALTWPMTHLQAAVCTSSNLWYKSSAFYRLE